MATRTVRAINRRTLIGVGIGGGLLFSLALAGCSSGGAGAPTAAPTQSGTTAKPAAATAKPTAAPATTKPASRVTVESLLDAARREGPLTYYASINTTTLQRMTDAFQAKYGIQTNGVRLTSGPLGQRYAAEAEADNVVADVIQISDPEFMDAAVEKGWLAAIDDLPSLDEWPKERWNGKFAAVVTTPQVIAWNTNLVPDAEAPKGLRDLVDQRWKGRMLLIDPRVVPSVLAFFLLLRETYGDDFLRSIAALEPRLVASSVQGSEQLAAGGAAILVPNTQSASQPLVDAGAPIKDAVFEPATGIENLAGVSAKSRNPNGARLLFNWVLSRECQELVSKDGYTPMLPNIPGAPVLPKSYQSPKIREAQAQQGQILSLLGIGG